MWCNVNNDRAQEDSSFISGSFSTNNLQQPRGRLIPFLSDCRTEVIKDRGQTPVSEKMSDGTRQKAPGLHIHDAEAPSSNSLDEEQYHCIEGAFSVQVPLPPEEIETCVHQSEHYA